MAAASDPVVLVSAARTPLGRFMPRRRLRDWPLNGRFRAAQDAYAMETLSRARKAAEGGAFKAGIVPITVKQKSRSAHHRQ